MIKANIQNFLSTAHLNNNKKLIVILGVVLALLLATSFIFGEGDAPKRPDQILTIPAAGNLPDLHETMERNALIRRRVEHILEFDEAALFVEYRKVNGIVAEILFLWAGLSSEQLQTMQGREAIDYFLRYVYGLPEDDPIKNNPVLDERPWARLFNRFKARLLMQGNGHKIYDGLAYYDTQSDSMVIQGTLAKGYMNGFKEFLDKQAANDRKRYLNNFLSYVNETKGFQNLTTEEKQLLQALNP